LAVWSQAIAPAFLLELRPLTGHRVQCCALVPNLFYRNGFGSFPLVRAKDARR
jgi:hypothetical protein